MTVVTAVTAVTAVTSSLRLSGASPPQPQLRARPRRRCQQPGWARCTDLHGPAPPQAPSTAPGEPPPRTAHPQDLSHGLCDLRRVLSQTPLGPHPGLARQTQDRSRREERITDGDGDRNNFSFLKPEMRTGSLCGRGGGGTRGEAGRGRQDRLAGPWFVRLGGQGRGGRAGWGQSGGRGSPVTAELGPPPATAGALAPPRR